MRFRLRTLLIVLALGPPILAIAYLTIASKPKPNRPQAGPWIDRATFQGNRQYSDKKLAKLIGLKSSTGIHGLRLNAQSAEQARSKIEQFYRGAGYRQATVTVLSGTKPADKELVLNICEGRPIAQGLAAP
jgi:hemolysin activation/secretion protein